MKHHQFRIPTNTRIEQEYMLTASNSVICDLATVKENDEMKTKENYKKNTIKLIVTNLLTYHFYSITLLATSLRSRMHESYNPNPTHGGVHTKLGKIREIPRKLKSVVKFDQCQKWREKYACATCFLFIFLLCFSLFSIFISPRFDVAP